MHERLERLDWPAIEASDPSGPLVFPFQLTCFLSEPGGEFSGGAFGLVENRPPRSRYALGAIVHDAP